MKRRSTENAPGPATSPRRGSHAEGGSGVALRSPLITAHPRVMGGKPCIRGMRVTVATIAGMLASGHSVGEVLELYPCLEIEDIEAVVEFTRTRSEDGVPQKEPVRAGDDLTYTIRSRRYPFLVEGRVEGLRFCLVEEGDTWRFVVSRESTVDPRTITSSRNGFVVSGRVALPRIQGEGPEMTDDQLHDLIDISRGILERRYREGRANDTPGLVRSASAKGPGE